MRIAGLLLVALLGLACAVSRTPPLIAEGFEGAPGLQRIALMPTNAVVTAPEPLTDQAEPITSHIARYLEAHDRQVMRLESDEARSHWDEAARDVASAGGPVNFENTIERFAQSRMKTAPFDALVVASLLEESVEVRSMNADWEGVKRRIRTIKAPSKPGSRSYSTEFRGFYPVTTLLVMVFNANGHKVFEGRGGLDVIYDADFSGMAEGKGWDHRLRPEIYDDVDHLEEGIANAFDPLLSPLRDW